MIVKAWLIIGDEASAQVDIYMKINGVGCGGSEGRTERERGPVVVWRRWWRLCSSVDLADVVLIRLHPPFCNAVGTATTDLHPNTERGSRPNPATASGEE